METTMKGKIELGKKLEIFLKFDVEHLFLILSSLREFLFLVGEKVFLGRIISSCYQLTEDFIKDSKTEG